MGKGARMFFASFNEFNKIIHSHESVRPTLNGWGVSAAPVAQNTYGNYAQIISGANVTDDVYGILLNFNNIGTNTIVPDSLATIGIDPAGGTSYTDFIVDLVCSGASGGNQPYPGVFYYFPIFIKAGTSIAWKLTQNRASAFQGVARCILYCQPTRPELIRVGQKVVTFGAVPASSNATSFTCGTTSEGTYTEIATLDRDYFYFEVGIGGSSTTVINTQLIAVDVAIGDATNKREIIKDLPISTISTEVYHKPPAGVYATGKSGSKVYVRGQQNQSDTLSSHAAIYAVC